jgi:hypothetical protein
VSNFMLLFAFFPGSTVTCVSTIRLVGLMCAVVAVFPATNAVGVVYVFEKIADTSTAAPAGTFTGFFNATASGDSASFLGSYSGGSGVFRGDGGSLTSVIQRNESTPFGTITFIDSATAMSGSTVAFSASYSGGNGIFTGSGGPLTKIVLTGEPAPTGNFEKLGTPAISGDNVAFRGTYIGGAGSGIFTGSGGPLTTIVKTGDAAPVGNFTGFGSPAVSGNTAALYGTYGGGQGIFTGSGGVLTTIAKSGDAAPSGTYTGFGTNPAISGNTVAAVGRYGANSNVLRGDGGTLTTIAKTGDAAPPGTITGFDNFSVSIGGMSVAFEAVYSGGTGVFVGDGGPLTTVVKTGDTLFGQTISSLNLARFGFDEGGSGNVAFTYTLSDGVSGVAMAIAVQQPDLPGDYNRDGVVDNADYVLWRKTFGDQVAYAAGADGNINGVIDDADYGVWQANFDESLPGGGNAGLGSVPEPGGGSVALIAMLLICFARRKASRPSSCPATRSFSVI